MNVKFLTYVDGGHAYHGAKAAGSFLFCIRCYSAAYGHWSLIRTYQGYRYRRSIPVYVYLATRIITTVLMIAGIITPPLQSQGLGCEGCCMP